eukprot:gene137-749_t
MIAEYEVDMLEESEVTAFEDGSPTTSPVLRPISRGSEDENIGEQETQQQEDPVKVYEKECPRNTPPPIYEGPSDKKNIGSPDGSLQINEVTSVDSSNFWLVGNYKKIVKKVEDGAKFCDELSQMLSERAEIESLYAKKLKAWNKKWLTSLSKGLEYGSLLHSVRSGISESNGVAEIHLAMQGKVAEVSTNIQNWRAENYHKGIMGLKEAKKSDEGFAKGQKPWAKRYNDVSKGKQTYHNTCQALDAIKQQEVDLKANTEGTTQEQLNKIQTKVKKAAQDRETALDNYKDALRDIGNYNPKYREDMTYEYDKWQTFESKRKDFIIEKLKEFKDCIDITRFHPKMVEIYSKMSEHCQIANSSDDVCWYRKTFGPDMKFMDISFVEYDPEMASIIKGKQKIDSTQNINSTDGERKKGNSKVCSVI